MSIESIVSTADIGANLDVHPVAIGLGLERTEYEPEQFPGVVYEHDEPSVVILILGTGKLVITGGKQRSDAAEAVEGLSAELNELGILEQ